MIPEIKALIEPFEIQIEDHSKMLPNENESVQQCFAFLSKLIEVGEHFENESTFLDFTSKSGMFIKMKEYLVELAIEDFEYNDLGRDYLEPTVSEMAQSFRDSYAHLSAKRSMPRTKKIYSEILTIEDDSMDYSEFLKKMAENNIFVRLTTMPILDRIPVTSSDRNTLPATKCYFSGQKKLAESALSSLEVENQSLKQTETYMIEVMLDSLLIRDLFGGLYASLKDFREYPTDKNRDIVRREFSFIREFFSIDLAEYFEIPRIRHFLENVVLPKERDKRPTLTFEDLLDELAGLLLSCVGSQERGEFGPKSRRSIRFWETDVDLFEVLSHMTHPIRPQEYT